MLKNKRFYVSRNVKQSRWKYQTNGIPRGSVVTSTLFNIYTNDQPIGEKTRHFICADDLAIGYPSGKF